MYTLKIYGRDSMCIQTQNIGIALYSLRIKSYTDILCIQTQNIGIALYFERISFQGFVCFIICLGVR